MPADLLPLEEAQARLLELAGPLPLEEVPLAQAAGRWLARDVDARLTHPPADTSAMDGWAVRFADLPGPLKVVGMAAAGHPFPGPVAPGQAVRIFTGAPLPAGADTVAVQEEMAEEGGCVRLMGEGPGAPGANVRPRGLDVRQGAVVGRAGERLTPRHLGLLAAAGLDRVPVRRRPRVVWLATGDELVPPGVEPGPGRIVSSNGVMVAAQLAAAGAHVEDRGILPDDREAIAAALAEAARDADVILTSGGASVGEHDLVRPVLGDLGAEIEFWRLAIRPGKPILAGRLGSAVVVGLPGNPVAAFVGTLLLAAPFVRHLAGDPDPWPRPDWWPAAVDLPAGGPRRDFQRARLERTDAGWRVRPFPVQDSSMLSVLAKSDALLVRPERAPPVRAGEAVPVLRLDGVVPGG
ncbi:MAG: molybdopterin molybdotransferase MoeA [Sphingomonadaceae bacterium]|uniref:molybdopterin molybdotransferase MoeA n=1 Tax=Thermaurantiacus sp. TaxID=2820283 RepID=UPI00298EF985|nr:gephyrin-like molybdotransferase Glp [Thermaurantiacus sp.]MCS6986523.1 molybdopterin molybdotransferase MoeA [Sphingomonadaceae bacterium]MDW8414216.1 molybdopterin molybdotransferase MoeA [Thermaurantiacus sp.]